MPSSYVMSSVDQGIAVAHDLESAKQAYQNPYVNTVLVASPLARAFDYAAAVLSPDEINACAGVLEFHDPKGYRVFDQLSKRQQGLVLDIKSKEQVLTDIFLEVVGPAAFVDVYKYVPARYGFERTAIPHQDECDSHMTATLIGRDGTVLYAKDLSQYSEADFKAGRVFLSKNQSIEVNPEYLCFIKGTDHPHIVGSESLQARWHSSPILLDKRQARLANFFAMKNGFGA